MANLKAIEARTRSVVVDLGDGDMLNVTYRPAAYTPAFEARTQEGLTAGDRDTLGRMVAEIVTDWDLYEDEKQTRKVPITPERVRDLPMILITPVMETIGKALNPNSRSAVQSGAGSME